MTMGAAWKQLGGAAKLLIQGRAYLVHYWLSVEKLVSARLATLQESRIALKRPHSILGKGLRDLRVNVRCEHKVRLVVEYRRQIYIRSVCWLVNHEGQVAGKIPPLLLVA